MSAHDLAAILDEPAPCDTCKYAGLCAATGIACRAFAAYIRGEPWGCLPREPDLETGKRLGLVSDQDITRLRQQIAAPTVAEHEEY